MTTNQKGNLGEAKVLNYFLQQGYEVYLPFGTATENDMVVVKDNLSQRVSVKTTKSINQKGRYEIRIRQCGNNKRTLFENNKTDILAVYIIDTDEVTVFNSIDIKNKSCILITPK